MLPFYILSYIIIILIVFPYVPLPYRGTSVPPPSVSPLLIPPPFHTPYMGMLFLPIIFPEISLKLKNSVNDKKLSIKKFFQKIFAYF